MDFWKSRHDLTSKPCFQHETLLVSVNLWPSCAIFLPSDGFKGSMRLLLHSWLLTSCVLQPRPQPPAAKRQTFYHVGDHPVCTLTLPCSCSASCSLPQPPVLLSLLSICPVVLPSIQAIPTGLFPGFLLISPSPKARTFPSSPHSHPSFLIHPAGKLPGLFLAYR